MLASFPIATRTWLADLLPETIWNHAIACYIPHFALECKLIAILKTRKSWRIELPHCIDTPWCRSTYFELSNYEVFGLCIYCHQNQRYSLFDLQMLTAPEYRDETRWVFAHEIATGAICLCHWHFFCETLPRLIQETLE
jgi:hypothetical protein